MYIVKAYKFGNRDKHMYTCGLLKSLEDAKILAQDEEYRRGGKYSCVVDKIHIGKNNNEVRVYETEAFALDQIRNKKNRSEAFDQGMFYTDELKYIQLLDAALRDVPFLTSEDNRSRAQERKEDITTKLNLFLQELRRIAHLNKSRVSY